jgi:hypothetical protein
MNTVFSAPMPTGNACWRQRDPASRARDADAEEQQKAYEDDQLARVEIRSTVPPECKTDATVTRWSSNRTTERCFTAAFHKRNLRG